MSIVRKSPISLELIDKQFDMILLEFPEAKQISEYYPALKNTISSATIEQLDELVSSIKVALNNKLFLYVDYLIESHIKEIDNVKDEIAKKEIQEKRIDQLIDDMRAIIKIENNRKRRQRHQPAALIPCENNSESKEKEQNKSIINEVNDEYNKGKSYINIKLGVLLREGDSSINKSELNNGIERLLLIWDRKVREIKCSKNLDEMAFEIKQKREKLEKIIDYIYDIFLIRQKYKLQKEQITRFYASKKVKIEKNNKLEEIEVATVSVITLPNILEAPEELIRLITCVLKSICATISPGYFGKSLLVSEIDLLIKQYNPNKPIFNKSK